MHSARSAIWTWGAPRSPSEKTATVSSPIFSAVFRIRTAISPRLATRIRLMGFIILPDEDLNRGGIVGVAGIVDLWAIGNQTEYTGFRPQFHIATGGGDPVLKS